MANKDKGPQPEKEPAKSGSAPDKTTRPKEAPEVVPPKESIPPALAPSSKTKKENKSSGIWGLLVIFLLIVSAGLAGGGFYLYQEQMKFQNESLAKLSQLEAQLNALDTEADQTRQNKQSIDTLNQDLQQFKTEMDSTLKSHQSSLATLDEDVMRLKEKVVPSAEVPPASSAALDDKTSETELVPGGLFPEDQEETTPESTEAEEDDPNQESQKFVEWMENFFAAIWNWFAGLFK